MKTHLFCFLSQAEETPLHLAARIKDGEKVAEMLIKSGADVNAPSDVSLATCLMEKPDSYSLSFSTLLLTCAKGKVFETLFIKLYDFFS